MKVYLAGDMVTPWRDEVVSQVNGVEWLIPTFRPDWFQDQTRMLDECDMLFAYIGPDARNIGTVAELSAVRVMNKPRVLVIHPTRLTDRAYDIASQLAGMDRTTIYMAEGIKWLREATTQTQTPHERMVEHDRA
jgi:nucleoside 2-deoxyribosyltransferase